VPGQHCPACGHVFQSQRSSRNSDDFRSSGEVSARCGVDNRACNHMQVLYKRHVISSKPKRQSQYIVDDARL